MKKLAVITGASRGIGAYLTRALAERGIDVIAVARQKACLETIQADYPERITIISADLSELKGRTSVIGSLSKHTKIDYLVHNAGVITPIAPLSNLSEENIRKILETNLITPMLLTTQLLPQMKKKSRILHISSPSGHQATAGLGPYCISKAGINMLTQIQRIELQVQDILSTYVLPGEVDTDMQQDLREASLNNFPLASEFQKAKDLQTLIPTETSAGFLSWLLLETQDEEYGQKEWNIYDTSHHGRWLKTPLPLPINKNKSLSSGMI